ncbi:MAG: 1-acyl-sn-glycerol-3-phosphate acyltransferase [Syntrophobacterales bacterium]|nr:MAG: 1-acyl-sn-glycerol-3-phosphate acyltransferase [Syntrophobacterales bacterium]
MNPSSAPVQGCEPNSFITLLRTAAIYVWVIFSTLLFSLLAIATSLVTRSGNSVHRVGRMWSRSILAASGIQVAVSGMERIDPARPYIFMSNHQSNFDIPVLLAHLPVQFRWLAKAELFKIPVFGRAMRGAGYISIDRADREAAFKSLGEASEAIRKGVAIMIFPEGTRSLDGTLKPFKKGGFVLAVDAGVPIVPVAIRGTHAIMAKRTWIIRPRDVAVEVGEPIDTSDCTRATKEALMERVRAAIRHGLGECG